MGSFLEPPKIFGVRNKPNTYRSNERRNLFPNCPLPQTKLIPRVYQHDSANRFGTHHSPFFGSISLVCAMRPYANRFGLRYRFGQLGELMVRRTP